jgi:HD superfamily phosphohydrolase
MYGSRAAMTASPTRKASAAAQLRRELLANMEHLQRLYSEEKEARQEAEQELMDALQLVKQAQTMAANGRKEAAALRRRLVATEEDAHVMETSLRRQLAEAQANASRNRIPDVPSSPPRRNGSARDEVVSSGAGFVRK